MTRSRRRAEVKIVWVVCEDERVSGGGRRVGFPIEVYSAVQVPLAYVAPLRTSVHLKPGEAAWAKVKLTYHAEKVGDDIDVEDSHRICWRQGDEMLC